jgi:hypothetical protein
MRRDRPALFKGRHFEPEVIVLCVRRYLSIRSELAKSGRDHRRTERACGSRYDLEAVKKSAFELPDHSKGLS